MLQMNKPEDYLVLNTYQGKDAKEVLERFLPKYPWSSGEKIIDVGSGPGNVTSGILLPALPKDATLVNIISVISFIIFYPLTLTAINIRKYVSNINSKLLLIN